jgi:2-polyprenyl-3-methyl-5-hydroxy-6-metoxy-1,4-benzoquinol methylase
MSEAARTTIDQAEVDRFSAMAAEWWDPTGKFRPLHKFNPVRLTYIRDLVSAQFGRDPKAHRPSKACVFSISAAAAACCPSRWPAWGRMCWVPMPPKRTSA